MRKHTVTFDNDFPVIIARFSLGPTDGQTPNFHDYLEISQIVEGRGVFHAANRDYELTSGDFLLIGSGEFHYAEARRGVPLVIRCLFLLP
jgi:mannose-6-phosphate isomerase-like protein (cupin superfamily)